jgi:hypothetical protein
MSHLFTSIPTRQSNTMKTTQIRNTAAFAMMALITTFCAPVAKAANLKMDGGFVTLGRDRTIRLSQASGRYADLGRGYYRTTTIGCTAIKNTSPGGRSGQISLEYWALESLSGGTEKVMMSVLLPALGGGKSLKNVKQTGPARYFDAFGYIQLRVYENSGGTWQLRAKKNIGNRQAL